jgi:PadR family transcriptional regulator, regulatory protein PadR
MARKQVPELTRLETVILSVLASKESYGLEVIDAVKEMGQRISLAGLYTCLNRMEEAGLVAGRWGAASEGRHGNRRRYFSVTALGATALRETRAVFKRALRLTPGPAFDLSMEAQ